MSKVKVSSGWIDLCAIYYCAGLEGVVYKAVFFRCFLGRVHRRGSLDLLHVLTFFAPTPLLILSLARVAFLFVGRFFFVLVVFSDAGWNTWFASVWGAGGFGSCLIGKRAAFEWTTESPSLAGTLCTGGADS